MFHTLRITNDSVYQLCFSVDCRFGYNHLASAGTCLVSAEGRCTKHQIVVKKQKFTEARDNGGSRFRERLNITKSSSFSLIPARSYIFLSYTLYI